MKIEDEPPPARIAPEVTAILKSGLEEPVEVVYQMRGSQGQKLPSPDEMDSCVNELLKKVSLGDPTVPLRHNVFKNFGSFVLLAPPKLHQQILKEPSIKAAVMNQSKEAG